MCSVELFAPAFRLSQTEKSFGNEAWFLLCLSLVVSSTKARLCLSKISCCQEQLTPHNRGKRCYVSRSPVLPHSVCCGGKMSLCIRESTCKNGETCQTYF